MNTNPIIMAMVFIAFCIGIALVTMNSVTNSPKFKYNECMDSVGIMGFCACVAHDGRKCEEYIWNSN